MLKCRAVLSTPLEPPSVSASATFALMSPPTSNTPVVSTKANTTAKHISNTQNFVIAAKALTCPLRLFLIIPPLKSNFPFAFKKLVVPPMHIYARICRLFLCMLILPLLTHPFQPLNQSHPTPSPFLIFPPLSPKALPSSPLSLPPSHSSHLHIPSPPLHTRQRPLDTWGRAYFVQFLDT